MRYVQGTTKPTRRPPSGQSWDDFGNKINRTVLDYNPKCQISIYESILIKIND